MDDLDRALLDAWSRLAPRVRADRLEAARRARRRTGATLSRPVRPWCLALRASDTRLEAHAAIAPFGAFRRNLAHTLYIDAAAIRKLCAPVVIPWPGLRARVAAARLGRHQATILKWAERGVFRLRHEAPSVYGARGKPIPEVWSPSPLDPNANLGRAPDPVWGTMWQYHHTRVPDDLTLIVDRVPRYRPDRRGSRDELGRARGWEFVCPGPPLPGPSGEVEWRQWRARGEEEWPEEPEEHPPVTCGRRVMRLYCPLPGFTLGRLLGEDPLEEAGSGDGAGPGRSYFACPRCHRLSHLSLQGDGWNQLVAYLTGGVLYGHEVERPGSAAYRRKMRYAPKPRPAPRRDRVMELLLRGLSYKEIGAELGMTVGVVNIHVKRIYRLHGVHSRAELMRELGVPAERARLSALYTPVRDLILEGLTLGEVASRLGVPGTTVTNRAGFVYRFYGVRTRRELASKLGGRERRARLTPKMAEVRGLLVEGLSYKEGAARLGLQYKTFAARAAALYRWYGVESREELLEKLGGVRGAEGRAGGGETRDGRRRAEHV